MALLNILHCIVSTGLFVSLKNQWFLSAARQVVKGHFHSVRDRERETNVMNWSTFNYVCV